MTHSQNLVNQDQGRVIYKNNLNNAKCDFRKKCIERLRFSSNIAKIKKDKYICSKIFELILLHKPKTVLAYIPLDIEVNILPLINKLRREKICEVYVPFMVGKTFKAVKYRLPLKKKQFGIKEPNNSHLKVKIDLAIVPIIGTDKTNRRVGFGRGMYDRFFENLSPQPVKIFTQTVLCKSETTVTSIHDIKADFIITNK
ncbi:MAG: 5-formyltetrahydrofolate cyclo-ligase [Arcobacteraceae bacterium]|nr:5-formyltetrahydrofolate cyclo-ligase [Arcobacteraceae bacterium]